jgi:hypothetical protein
VGVTAHRPARACSLPEKRVPVQPLKLGLAVALSSVLVLMDPPTVGPQTIWAPIAGRYLGSAEPSHQRQQTSILPQTATHPLLLRGWLTGWLAG